MHTAVKLGLDKTSSLDIPAFEDEEIDLWLNKAQDRFVKQRLFGNNYVGKSFEMDSKRISDLEQLVVNKETSVDPWTEVTEYPNTTSINISAEIEVTGPPVINFMYYISSRSKISRTNPTIADGYVDNVMISHVDIPKFVSTGYNSPRFVHPVCWIEDGFIYIMHDDLTTEYDETDQTFFITFIKEPVEMDLTGVVSCELDASTHEEIVDIAVNMMIENIESPRFQTNIEKLKTQE